MSITKKEVVLECPMCSADLELGEDPPLGKDFICQFCESPLKIRKKKKTDELYLEEDF